MLLHEPLHKSCLKNGASRFTSIGIQAAWIDGDSLGKSFQTESAVTAAMVKELDLKP